MPTKTIYHLAHPDKPQLLGSFELLADGSVRATYQDEAFERRMLRDGIFTPSTRDVRPRDGRRFYDALERAYANSSRIRIVES